MPCRFEFYESLISCSGFPCGFLPKILRKVAGRESIITSETPPHVGGQTWCVWIEDPHFLGRAKKGAAMLNDLCIQRNLAKQCGLCGRVRELFELPGRPEKFCLECSADLATVVQLRAEIGAATRAGTDTGTLESEASEMSRRILERSQPADLSEV
jgi:hypothetical protein